VIACDGGFRVVVGFDSLGGLLNGTVGFIAVHRGGCWVPQWSSPPTWKYWWRHKSCDVSI
jgi:hypothetical protein